MDDLTLMNVSFSAFKKHILGFFLSCMLTALPFGLVIQKIVSNSVIFCVILLSAALQIFIHFIFFLHMKKSDKDNWNIVALLFTMLIITIIITGSVWIMLNIHSNMSR